MEDKMYLIWSQLLIVFFGALFYLSKTDYSVIKSKTVEMKNVNQIEKFTALYNFEQYFKTFLTVFSYSVVILIIFTLFFLQLVTQNMANNINFYVIAYIHIILSLLVAIYITSRGTLKVTETGISISTVLFKKVFLFENIEFIRRKYIEDDEIGILEIVLKNKKCYKIDLDSYKKTAQLEGFINDLFADAQEKAAGEYIYKEEDKSKKIEIRNGVNFIFLILIVLLNIAVILIPGPNFQLGTILLIIELLFASNYRTYDIVLKNGMVRYKLWIGSKYRSIRIENINNIYLRDIAIDRKKRRIVSLVIYTKKGKTVEIPIFFIYKKRYMELIRLLNK